MGGQLFCQSSRYLRAPWWPYIGVPHISEAQADTVQALKTWPPLNPYKAQDVAYEGNLLPKLWQLNLETITACSNFLYVFLFGSNNERIVHSKSIIGCVTQSLDSGTSFVDNYKWCMFIFVDISLSVGTNYGPKMTIIHCLYYAYMT